MTPSQNESGKTSQELSELSSMIRRHAEELARLSGSLQGQSEPVKAPMTPSSFESTNTPPPQQNPLGEAPTRPPMAPGVPMTWNRMASDQGLPVLANDLAMNAESLPVLNAFRQFIEEERRQTRRRMIRLSLFTILGVIVVVAAATMAVTYSLARTRRQVDDIQEQSAKAQREHLARLQSMANSNSNVEKRLQRDRLSLLAVASVASNMQIALHNDHQNLARVRTDVDLKLSDQSQEMDKLKENIASLEIENAILSGSLREMTAMRDQASSPAESTGMENADVSVASSPLETGTATMVTNDAAVPARDEAAPVISPRATPVSVKASPFRLPDL